MYRKIMVLPLLIMNLFLFSAIGLTECNIPPRVGESLQYKVFLKSMIHGADQIVRVIEADTYRDRPVIKVQSVMDSVGLAKSLTKFTEKEEMILDREGLYPWIIRREVSDKDEIETEEVTFDYPNNVAVRIYSKNNGPQERSEIQVPGYVQDNLSLQFYLRKNYSQKENQLYFYSDGEIKKISYQIVEISETLKLDCGQFSKQYKVHNPEKNITILISDTPEHYPLVIQKIGKIGKIEAKLVEIK